MSHFKKECDSLYVICRKQDVLNLENIHVSQQDSGSINYRASNVLNNMGCAQGTSAAHEVVL